MAQLDLLLFDHVSPSWLVRDSTGILRLADNTVKVDKKDEI